MRLESYAVTDTGPVREHNEDSWGADVDAGLFVVADGMGGHAAGEVASRLAVETVTEIMLEEEDPDETRLLMAVDDPADRIRERLRYAMNQSSVRIRKAVESNPAQAGMGTTLVVLLVEGSEAHLAHVGDSRIYLFREGQLQRLTRDHTVVQQEVDAGRLTPELARTVPHKNILTKSVGYHGPVDPDATTRGVQHGDVFVLCSDGLTDPLPDSDIQTLCAEKHPEDLAQALVEAALIGGTEDNVTVMVVVASDD
jgi:protein phosphatase